MHDDLLYLVQLDWHACAVVPCVVPFFVIALFLVAFVSLILLHFAPLCGFVRARWQPPSVSVLSHGPCYQENRPP